MKKIYVHLGFPKTASTWFKEFFKNHTDINLIFDKKKISIVKLINDEKNFDKLYEMIHEKYDPKKVNILSDEDFLNPLFKTSVLNNFDYTVNLHNLRIFLKEFDFNIFYFYRRQEELIPSYISQNYSFLFKLKKYYSLNNTKNFTDYFLLDYKDQKNYRLRNLFDGFKFNNLNLKLFELFGIDKVNSFSFNEFESEKIFKNFCKYLNIDYVKMLEIKNDKYIIN